MSDFPRGEPLSLVEAELREAWERASDVHHANPTPETWQRKLAASGAYQAVYEWNRAV